jgi:hypothetical protein
VDGLVVPDQELGERIQVKTTELIDKPFFQGVTRQP